MDTIQKHKHHFNIVDIILILFLVAIIGGGIFLWLKSTQNLGSYPNLTYEVRIENIPTEVTISLDAGLPVFDDITGKQIGTLQEYSVVTEGASKTLQLKIQASGILNTEHFYQIDSYTISIGKDVSLRVGSFWGEGVCTTLIPGELEA